MKAESGAEVVEVMKGETPIHNASNSGYACILIAELRPLTIPCRSLAEWFGNLQGCDP